MISRVELTEKSPGSGRVGGGAGILPWQFALALGVAIAAVWPEVVLGSHTFIARDYGYFGFPLAHYHRASFWQGEIPLWNPFNNCGLPFLAQWNSLTLYPGSLLYLLLPLPWSLGMFCLLHLFWGGLGMYLLARRWTGSASGAAMAGAAFAFNGVLLNSLMWPNNIAALGWMPWVVLAAERGWRQGGRALGPAALLGAMQMLTGGPEVILLTWILLGVFAAVPRSGGHPGFPRRVVRLVGIGVFVALLSAAQLLPFLALLHQSQRDAHFFEGAWAMPASGWANLLVPLFGCLKTTQGRFYQWDQYWTSSYYAGMGVLALALLALRTVRRRPVWVLAGITGLGLVLALGEHGYLLPGLKRLFPPIGYLRYPIKIVIWVSFCLPLLAAYGVRGLEVTSNAPGRRRAPPVIALGLTLTLLSSALLLLAAVHPQPREQWADTATNGIVRIFALWVCLVSCLAAWRSRSVWVRSLPALVVGLDLLTAVPRLSPTVPRAVLRADLVELPVRPELGEARAMVTFEAHQQFNTFGSTRLVDDFLVKRAALFGNANLIDAIPKLDGFYSLYLNRADKVLSGLYLQTNHADVARILASTRPISFEGLYTFLGVACRSTEHTNYEWSVRTNVMPLLSSGQTVVLTNDAAALAGLFRPDFDPRRRVYLPLGSPARPGEGEPVSVQLLDARFGGNKIVALLQASGPALLVVAQAGHPNWQATLDEGVVPIFPANYAFQAIPVAAGRHNLRLRYRDPLFTGGLIVSVCALGVTSVARWRSLRFAGLRAA